MKAKKIALLILIIFMGGFLRFYKLDWGNGYFFHPDEHHISIAVGNLSFPDQMNPQFFSYGSFTIYLIYFSQKIVEALLPNFSFPPIIIGRFYSALFSTTSLIVIYFLSERLFRKKNLALLTTGIVAVTPGLIQQAHFATPESNLTFFLFLAIFLLIKYFDSTKIKFYFSSAFALGLAAGIKITATIITPILFFPLLKKPQSAKQIPKKFMKGAIAVVIIFFTYFAVFPFSILDFNGFKNSMNYESSVATGSWVVFYTRQFIDTKPIVFQFEKILPFTLGPTLLVLGTVGLIFLFYKTFRNLAIKKGVRNDWIVVLAAFSLFFLANSLLFAKWTRFIAPTFPFFAIFSVYLISELQESIRNIKIKKYIANTLILILTLGTTIWVLMFFSIYLKEDVRKSATAWMEGNLPDNSRILTEAGNTYEVPLSSGFDKISFDFYHLDENPELPKKLIQHLEASDYFIIQSRRMFMNHDDPNRFPITSRFYQALFSNELGLRKVKEFNSYPSLAGFEVDDEKAEETWSVFDHPVIRIYEKVYPLTKDDYAKILEI